MTTDGLSPRAAALIRELARYCKKYGTDVDRSHVEDLQAEIQSQIECEVNAFQRSRAAQSRAHRTGS